MTTIQLTSTTIAKEKGEMYFITGCNKHIVDRLFHAKRNNTLNQLSKELEIDCDNILKYGSKTQTSARQLSPYVSFLKGARIEGTKRREIHFRNYSKTEQEQREVMWLLNICTDSTSSASTILKAIKEEYLLLWKTKYNGEK